MPCMHRQNVQYSATSGTVCPADVMPPPPAEIVVLTDSEDEDEDEALCPVDNFDRSSITSSDFLPLAGTSGELASRRAAVEGAAGCEEQPADDSSEVDDESEKENIPRKRKGKGKSTRKATGKGLKGKAKAVAPPTPAPIAKTSRKRKIEEDSEAEGSEADPEWQPKGFRKTLKGKVSASKSVRSTSSAASSEGRWLAVDHLDCPKARVRCQWPGCSAILSIRDLERTHAHYLRHMRAGAESADEDTTMAEVDEDDPDCDYEGLCKCETARDEQAAHTVREEANVPQGSLMCRWRGCTETVRNCPMQIPRHLDSHHLHITFPCRRCDKGYTRVTDLKTHFNATHKASS
ncbi:hypothetical protein C8Q80DRAFT_777955 [Daedaleopsis nitida]|nr:hypothetical protein C8Q80DRAFT_777955 [Daedaleopsis nitida]